MGYAAVEESRVDIDPRSQAVYATLREEAGRPPQHNVFVQAAVQAGVSRSQARRDFQRLRGQPSPPPDQEDRLPTPQPSLHHDARPVAAQDLPAEPQALRAQVATLTLRLPPLEREVQELRRLVQVLSPKSNGPVPDLGEVVPRLGAGLAQLALLQTQVQSLAEQQTGLTQTVHALAARLAPWLALEQLARSDPDVRQALESLLQIASPSTKGTLHTAVAEALGWPRPTKYIRQ